MSHTILTHEKEQEIITKVIAAVEIARSQGLQIGPAYGLEPGDFDPETGLNGLYRANENMVVCPMACLIIGKDSNLSLNEAIAKELEISSEDVHCIIRGIDREYPVESYDDSSDECTPMYKLGARIAAIVWPPLKPQNQESQAEYQS